MDGSGFSGTKVHPFDMELSSEFAEYLYEGLNACPNKEARARFIADQFALKEIVQNLDRVKVRREIAQFIAAGKKIVVRAIARATEKSNELVTRILHSMLTHHMMPKKDEKYADTLFALPKESRPQEMAINILSEAGFRVILPVGRFFRKAVIVDEHGALPPMYCTLARTGDIFRDFERNKKSPINIALVGNDRISEYKAAAKLCNRKPAEIVVNQTYLDGYFSMRFAIPEEDMAKASTMSEWEYLEGKTILTSYPSIVNRILEDKGVTAEVIEADGGIEEKCRNWGAQVIFDIVATGESAREAGLTVFKNNLLRGNVSLISPQRLSTQDENCALVMKRLQSVQLENSRR